MFDLCDLCYEGSRQLEVFLEQHSLERVLSLSQLQILLDLFKHFLLLLLVVVVVLFTIVWWFNESGWRRLRFF